MSTITGITDKIDELIVFIDEKSDDNREMKDAFVIVTKWPTKGKSKTRLSKSIGEDLAVKFALCALKDLLVYYQRLPHTKYLLFAPKDKQSAFESLLEQVNLADEYGLIPMRDSDMTTSNLGHKLSGCVQDLQSPPHNIDGSICIIASDCVELRLKHINIAHGFTHNKHKKSAYVIQAIDGGYVLLDLPQNVSHKVFENVLWSHERTCESQMAAIKNCGIDVVKSDIVLADVDELEDWIRLYNNFGIDWNEANSDDQKHEQKCGDYNKLFANVSALLSLHSGQGFRDDKKV